MFGAKKFFGNNIPHNCDYCQNCIVEGGRNFCSAKKKINAKGKCPRFTYNPTMRKVNVQTIGNFSKEDFSL